MKMLSKRKNQIKLLIAFCVLTILAIVFWSLFVHTGKTLDSQLTAERFKGDSKMHFAQVSAFFPVGDGTDEQGMYDLRTALDAKLADASVTAENGGYLYLEGYCAQGQINVSGDKGSASVSVIGVGGDFFEFHPLRLLSGSYIAGDDLMHDRVILDKELAWRLFGGTDLAGLTVTINNKPYLIAGVIDREDDFASEKTYTAGPGMFMAYDALKALSDVKVSCYEVVCADPISGFVRESVESSYPTAEIIENSSRYSVSKELKVLKNYSTRSIRDSAIAYPYWENAARMVEDRAAIYLLFSMIFAVLPAIAVVVAVILVLRYFWKKFKKWVPQYIERKKEERYDRKISERTGR